MAKGFGIFGSLLKAGAKVAKAANKSLEKAQKQAERNRLKEYARIEKEQKASLIKAQKSLIKIQKQAERLQLQEKSTKVKAHESNFNKDLYRPVVSGTNIIYASPIPKTVDMGNLIFEKKYEAAITLGKKLLSTCPVFVNGTPKI